MAASPVDATELTVGAAVGAVGPVVDTVIVPEASDSFDPRVAIT